jgi:hypothetical protein
MKTLPAARRLGTMFQFGGKGEGGITAKEENEPRSALIEIGPDFLAHSLIVEKKVHCGISG